MTGEYFVESDGPDGLKHHVGPFKTREEAEEWIARHSAQMDARHDLRCERSNCFLNTHCGPIPRPLGDGPTHGF